MKALYLITILLGCTLLMAQWSMDASAPTLVAGGPGEQSLPKVAITTDQNIYISRFDNSGGAYQAILKYYSPAGMNLWSDPGEIPMPGNINESWLTDYDLTADQDGNALLCLQDIRSGINNVYIYKVLPSGAQAWGQNGLSLSADNSGGAACYTPVVLNTSTNTTWVAWQQQADGDAPIRVQRLDADGNLLWASPLMVSTLGADNTWPQFVEGNEGSVWMKYYSDSGPFWAPNRQLKIAHYADTGEVLGMYTISTAGGIAAWTQIIGFVSDGDGGACLAWHDDRNNDMINEAYFARISSFGSITTPANGALLTTNTGQQQYYPKLVADGQAERAYIIFKTTDSGQILSGISAQIMDYSGNRHLGESGMVLNQLSSFSTNSLYAYKHLDRVGLVYSISTVPSSDQDLQIRIWSGSVQNPDEPWIDQALATDGGAKFHYDFDFYPTGWFMSTWEAGNNQYDIYAMRCNPEGLGAPFYPPTHLQAEFIPPFGIHLSWVSPVYLLPELYWVYFNNDPVVTVPGSFTECSFEAFFPGTYAIHLIAEYAGEIASPPSETVNVTVVANDDPLTPSMPFDLTIYPNPARDNATLKWYSDASGPGTVSLYNLRGQLLSQTKLPSSAKGWQSWELADLDYVPGVYLVHLKTGTKSQTKKLLISK
ncbi:MAG TPA: T9SS type A sorting domain-containing protein [Candidatus Cloacimonadota bacterium]|nr:T9SS type A sorting domain-containing protein [Candidatus Cloacimonadota bacterium]